MRWPDLRTRSEAAELMDDLAIGGAELSEALGQLRLINYVLSGGQPTVEGVDRLWKAAGRPLALHILDIGAGSGEVSRHLFAWAERRHVQLRITLSDIHPETCAVAAAYHQHEPRITVQQGDAFALAPEAYDMVTASLFTHHFSRAQLPTLLTGMVRAARFGVVINDLHRHWLAWLSIALATRLLSRNRMIRHDAPLSVQRGFRRAELERLREIPELARLRCSWRPFFRYLVLITRAEVAGHG
jgi:2-polyprenyl-3-methyl-5-hydroxy-6-metoxy-1,4-benzoquinol methylase